MWISRELTLSDIWARRSFACVFCLICSLAAAKDLGFHLKASPAEPTVGDVVIIQLEAKDPSYVPDHVKGILSEADEEKWHQEAKWHRDWGTQQNGQAGPWLMTLRPFETGLLTIPPTSVLYEDAGGTQTEIKLTTATLSVKSVLQGAGQTNFVGLREPAQIPRDFSWIWITLLVLLICAVAGWLILRWWQRRSQAGFAQSPSEPQLPPGLWALREIDRRSRLPVNNTGPVKVIFTMVSDVIRHYLNRRYGIHAIDMTTYECLRALHALGPGDELLRWLKEFFDECDTAKFSRLEPPRERWTTIWNDARLIVQMSTPPEELGEKAPAPQTAENGDVA